MPFDGTQLSDVTKLLIESRRSIEAGWCQGSYYINDKFCMVGAVREHGGPFSTYHDWRTLAFGYLARAIESSALLAWNDMPGRTKEEVLAAFDRAIELSMRD